MSKQKRMVSVPKLEIICDLCNKEIQPMAMQYAPIIRNDADWNEIDIHQLCADDALRRLIKGEK